jgi:hypothetical protein
MMPDPDQNGVLIAPAIDDELTVTVRIRLASPTVRDQIGGPALISLPGRLHAAIKDLLSPGDVNLAGLEVTLPTFKPYGTGGAVAHEFTGEVP